MTFNITFSIAVHIWRGRECERKEGERRVEYFLAIVGDGNEAAPMGSGQMPQAATPKETKQNEYTITYPLMGLFPCTADKAVLYFFVG